MGLCFCPALVDLDAVDIAALYCVYFMRPCNGMYKVRGDLFFHEVKEDLLSHLSADGCSFAVDICSHNGMASLKFLFCVNKNFDNHNFLISFP
jgi:hypothetical protein